MKGEYVISGKPNPDLNGPVTFHLPSLYEKVAIGRRKAELSAPAKWEELPSEERALVHAIATLEHVIDTAPKGFYQELNGKPVLAPGRLAEHEDESLWEVMAAYYGLVERFRQGERNPPGDAGLTGSTLDREGGPGSGA